MRLKATVLAILLAACSQPPAGLEADATILVTGSDVHSFHVRDDGWGHLRLEAEQRHQLTITLLHPPGTAVVGAVGGLSNVVEMAGVGARAAVLARLADGSLAGMAAAELEDGTQTWMAKYAHSMQVSISAGSHMDVWFYAEGLPHAVLTIFVDPKPGVHEGVVERYDWILDDGPGCADVRPVVDHVGDARSPDGVTRVWGPTLPTGIAVVGAWVSPQSQKWHLVLETNDTSPIVHEELPREPTLLEPWQEGFHETFHLLEVGLQADVRFQVDVLGPWGGMDAGLSVWSLAETCS